MAELVVERNLREVFGERDGARRIEALQRLYAQDAIFYEGEEVFTGWTAIGERFAAILDPAPSHFVFTVVGTPGRIQDLEQLAWQFGAPNEAPVAAGLDVARIADGKIQTLYTFLEPVKS